MTTGRSVADHYGESGPLARVSAALDAIAPAGAPVTLDQLGGFDDFHTGGRAATARLADLLAPGPADTVLDAGAGTGGPARYLADRFGCRVVGVDLTPALVEIGTMLNDRTGMGDLVELRVGDVTALPLEDETVDHAGTQHVAMNIADRAGLYAEMRRVVRTGGRFALYDVIDGGGGELVLPVPWASEAHHSHLVDARELRALLEGAGFRIDIWEDPTEEMTATLRTMVGRMLEAGAAGGPPALTTALLVDDVAERMSGYLRNLDEGRTALVIAVCTAC